MQDALKVTNQKQFNHACVINLLLGIFIIKIIYESLKKYIFLLINKSFSLKLKNCFAVRIKNMRLKVFKNNS